MKISVVSKQPPGGRCSLYMAFADAAAKAIDGQSEVLYPLPTFPRPEEPLPPAPALLVDGRVVEPADGVLLDPEEVCAAVVAAGFEGDAAPLLEALEAEQERMMEEWANE